MNRSGTIKVTIFNTESAQEVMEQLRFVLMEFGVVLEVEEKDAESMTYLFVPAAPLDTEEQ